MRPKDFLKTLRDSDDYISTIFLHGGCYKLYLVLKKIYPEAEPYIRTKDGGHVITKIGNSFYDIKGKVSSHRCRAYRKMTKEDMDVASKWNFAKHNWLVINDCPSCGEPIYFDAY